MSRTLALCLAVHFLGIATYVVVVDELYCQGDYKQKAANDCYGWKQIAGAWEIVVLQELVIRPIVKVIK